MIPRALPVFVLVILALLVMAAPGVHAEEAPAAKEKAQPDDEATQKAKAYAREQLLEAARRVVQPGKLGEKELQPLKQVLYDDIVWFTSYVPKNDEERKILEQYEKTIEARVLLLGQPAEQGAEGAGSRGALQEADLLYLWLLGLYRCDLQIWDRRGGQKTGEARFYPFPPPDSETKPAPAVETPGAEAAAGSGEASAEKPPAEGADPEVPQNGPGGKDASSGEAKKKEGEGKEGAKPEGAPLPKSPAAPPKELDKWGLWVVNKKEGGTLLEKVVETSQCSTVTALELAESTAPVVNRDLGGQQELKRHALVQSSPFGYNRPFIELRALQSGQRVNAFRNEEPPSGLVDESMVREKAKRSEHFRDQAKRWKDERANVLLLADGMVRDILGWRMKAAHLSGLIEEEKRRTAPTEGESAEGVAPRSDEPSLRLRLLAASESLVTLELRLFYHTVLRASLRLELLDELIVIADNEAAAADTARERFSTALAVLRNKRQLDRLKLEAFQLEGWEAFEEKNQPAFGEAGRLRIAALQAVHQVNEGVQKLVERRRKLSESASRSTKRAQPQPRAKEAAEASPSAKAEEPAKGEVRRSVSKLNAQMLDPASSTWDLEWIQLATQQLQDPEVASEFDATLVAEHYAAADQAILVLQTALSSTSEVAEAAELEASLSRAKLALKPLEERRDAWTYDPYRLPSMVAGLERDIREAQAGIEAQREEQRRRLEAARAYRALLLDQGPRSLAIRVGGQLDTEELREAAGEAADASKTALRWMQLDGEPNLMTFLRSNWWAILLLIALALGLSRFVQRARRRLDRHLDEMAAEIPELRWTGASVTQEQALAKARKQAEDEALQAAEEEVLRQAGGDQTDESPEATEEQGESVEREKARVLAEAAALAGEPPPEKAVAPPEKPPETPPATPPAAPKPGGGS